MLPHGVVSVHIRHDFPLPSTFLGLDYGTSTYLVSPVTWCILSVHTRHAHVTHTHTPHTHTHTGRRTRVTAERERKRDCVPVEKERRQREQRESRWREAGREIISVPATYRRSDAGLPCQENLRQITSVPSTYTRSDAGLPCRENLRQSTPSLVAEAISPREVPASRNVPHLWEVRKALSCIMMGASLVGRGCP
jgi:hypothetical protein